MNLDQPARLAEHPLLGPYERGPEVEFRFEDTTVTAHAGESLGAALLAAGIRTLRVSRQGEPRGLYCAIGQCLECRVTVEGAGTRRACLTPVEAGMVVRRHRDPRGPQDAEATS